MRNGLPLFSGLALLLVAAWLQAQPPVLNSAQGEVVASPAVVEPVAPPLADAETEAAAEETAAAVEAAAAAAETEAAQSKREEVSEELRVAQRTLETAKETAAETAKETSDEEVVAAPEPLQREVELLKQLEVVVAQQGVAKKEHQDLKMRLEDLTAQVEAVRVQGPPEQPPYSFLMLDHSRDELAARQARTETVESVADGADAEITRAKQTLETRQQAYRLAREAAEANTDEEKKTELANELKFAELEVRIATESLAQAKQEQANQELAQKLHTAQVDLLQAKVVWFSKASVFSDRDLQEQMIEIDKHEEDLRNELRRAESNLKYAESEWTRARSQLDSATEKSVELVQQVEAKQLARQRFHTMVSLLNVRLQRRGVNRELWQRRFHVIRRTAKTEELITWSEEARARLDQLEREKRIDQMRIDELRQDMAGRDKLLQSADIDKARRWIEDQRDTLGRIIQVYDANIVSIESSRRLTEKLISEIEGDVNTWTLADWSENFYFYAEKIWNTELTTVDDHPLTVGKVLVGMFLILCGFALARLLSRSLGKRLQHRRFRMNESGVAALQSLSFYVLLVGFTLTALKFVNVPLTMFAFLGGAIAIGVGFGSQNILNNFISGLILLAERPIKVGDLIQIDDLYGNVEQIGARSTRIRTGRNMEIIVPNSTFLESNVVNLTRGDDKLRTQVNIGIAYGSSTREATRLLKHAATEHGRVLKQPEPFVWFAEFGDNALNFELHFWVKVRSVTEQKRIESDLRFQIDHLFREAEISIAFPQRDIHLDTTRPIAVQFVPAENEEPGRDQSENEAA
ncbi:mechanosensitive ion channel domain-containing protein [Lignipirellula cremea]|uniref:Mechanosensitive channel MscK n=1 Tax=Lignipirellula cremea TaxID=2528010 RepID=A0A518E3N2_9BACT|nr:mechanosensitive ion channel domain-containing protein [Lignipirellula cremea]QDU98699.1 Mechanosensitive channel MscK precursor [Lignipirellula cremea]